MFSGSHFYHETIRRCVSVFGTLFNDISVMRKDNAGNVLNISKVPLAYGPKQKFLSRIDQESDLTDPKIAIKLPRMSFEMTSLSYDSSTKLQRGLKQTVQLPAEAPGQFVKKEILGPVGYRIGIQLNIMTKNQDDGLQIIEQILPYFQPDYTVTIKQVDDNFKSDMPFILSGITMTDDYEGDYVSRRAIVFSLDFESRIRFYGETDSSAVIRRTITDIKNGKSNKTEERQIIILNPFDSDPTDEYGVDISYNFGAIADEYIINVDDASIFEVNDMVLGIDTLSQAQIKSITDNDITLYKADGIYKKNENITLISDNEIFTQVNSITETWYDE